MRSARIRHAAFYLLSCFALGCAAQQGNVVDADAQSTSPQVRPGAQCLIDASAERVVPKDAPHKIEVAHILVRHASLPRPQGSSRSREEACLHALSALETLQGGAAWNEVVDQYSDSAKTTHGKLGRVSRDEVTGAFGDAAFSLAPNELSYVVESDRGFHVILRLN